MHTMTPSPITPKSSRRGAGAAGRGFTLIELLIVVAIIAILAAIAIPNFLEAQMRAKVSRVRSDLRTLATGIESFQVDKGKPPSDGENGEPHVGWATALGRMTTPIAYITSLPADPFQDSTLPETNRPGTTHFLDAAGTRHSYDYGTFAWEVAPGDLVREAEWESVFGYSPWKLTSAGPDLRFDNPGSFYGFRARYDPTNGTTSLGDLVRSAARTE
jgi:prepilin-type N-terminal cleavage/methylation domain-containing protein